VFLRSLRRLLVTTNVVPSSPILDTLMMGAISSSETSVLTRVTRRNVPEDAVLPCKNSFVSDDDDDYDDVDDGNGEVKEEVKSHLTPLLPTCVHRRCWCYCCCSIAVIITIVLQPVTSPPFDSSTDPHGKGKDDTETRV
jgi:hypothetical protein